MEPSTENTVRSTVSTNKQESLNTKTPVPSMSVITVSFKSETWSIHRTPKEPFTQTVRSLMQTPLATFYTTLLITGRESSSLTIFVRLNQPTLELFSQSCPTTNQIPPVPANRRTLPRFRLVPITLFCIELFSRVRSMLIGS